jgi:hypothetical protein
MISITLAILSQLVGTSAFLYYGPEIIEKSNADVMEIDEPKESADILDNIIVIAFVFGNLISAFVIYEVGRRPIVFTAIPIACVTAFALAYTMH